MFVVNLHYPLPGLRFVYGLLVAFLHSGPVQAAVFRAGELRAPLAGLVVPVAGLRQQHLESDDIRPVQPRVPDSLQGDPVVPVQGYQLAAEKRELRRTVRHGLV